MIELSIREEQAIQLSLLHFFDELCKKEGYRYFLAYGTLLGAIRDNGFIDWDDDIDLWMLREDFDKLNSRAREFSTPEYFFQNVETDIHMPVPGMLRICVNGTYKWPLECRNKKFNKGIYFDIFPLDFECNDSVENKKKAKKFLITNSIIWNKLGIKYENMSWKACLFQKICMLVPKRILNKLGLASYPKRNLSKEKLICLPTISVYPNKKLYYDDFSSSVLHKFEDMMCPCPVGFQRILHEIYGDWETPQKTKPRYTKAYLLDEPHQRGGIE